MLTQVNEADPRVRRTRTALRDALMALMRERRFRDISVQDIADRADINRATFYAHFEDKYALAEACMRAQFRDSLAERQAPDAQWSSDNLRHLILTVMEFLGHVYHGCAPSDRELDPLMQAAMHGEMLAVLIAWATDPAFPRVPRGTTTATLLTVWTWAIFGAATEWARDPRGVPADEAARQIAAALCADR